MKIYTKKGDQGKTQLFGGKLVSKADLRIGSYGEVDELNSFLGILRADFFDFQNDSGQKAPWISEILHFLEAIQNDLFCIGGRLATPIPEMRAKLPRPPAGRVAEMESQIDSWSEVLPALQNFILPGGHSLAANLHLARTITRRCERIVVSVQEAGDTDLAPDVVYLNRLSDYFFTAARFVNFVLKIPDELWTPANG